MKKRKILFVREGEFSFTNGSLLERITKFHPDHEIIDFDVKKALLRRPFDILAGLVSEIRHYGLKVLLNRGDRSAYFFKNPVVFKRASTLVSRKFSSIRDDIDLIFQTTGLMNTDLGDVPLVIYTDYMLKSVQFDDIAIPQELIDLETELFRRARAVTVSAAHVKETLVKEYRCEADRIHVVHIGSNIPGDFENFALDRYSAQKICFIGIEWGRKGGKYLVDAFLDVARRFPDATLTIIGCIPPVSHPQIRALGRIPRTAVKEILQQSSIFCLPSIVEPSSVAAIEGATYGMPVIATHTGGFLDSVEDGVTGILVPPKDSSALSSALRRLLQDPARAREMGIAGRKRALATFDWDVVGAKIATVIAPLLAEQRPR